MTVVCTACFGDDGLRKRIEQERRGQDVGNCPIHPRYKGLPITTVAEIVDPVFRAEFAITSGWPSSSGESLQDVLYALTGAEDERTVEALADALASGEDVDLSSGEESFYDPTLEYARDDHVLWSDSATWARLRQRLLHSQRFFNSPVLNGLKEIFEGVHLQRGPGKRNPVYTLLPEDPTASFHRARVVDTDTLVDEVRANPAAKLGPPPERRRRPGRLNPSGIAAFYGAFDMDTCVAELRPAVGSLVVGARPTLTKSIVVLDMTRFEDAVASHNRFAKGETRLLTQHRFMQVFMREISQPVSPSDEHLDYVPTQAVAEFLVHHHTFNLGGRRASIDAIIYRSAQNGAGLNIALLSTAARVRLPPGTASTTEDVYDELFGGFDEATAGLVVDPTSVEVRRVTGARYDSEVVFDAPILGVDDWEG